MDKLRIYLNDRDIFNYKLDANLQNIFMTKKIVYITLYLTKIWKKWMGKTKAQNSGWPGRDAPGLVKTCLINIFMRECLTECWEVYLSRQAKIVPTWILELILDGELSTHGEFYT